METPSGADVGNGVAVGLGVEVGRGVLVLVTRGVFVEAGVAVAPNAPPPQAKTNKVMIDTNIPFLKMMFCFIRFSLSRDLITV